MYIVMFEGTIVTVSISKLDWCHHIVMFCVLNHNLAQFAKYNMV